MTNYFSGFDLAWFDLRAGLRELRSKRTLSTRVLFLGAGVLAGCAAGPDYHRPPLALPSAYRTAVPIVAAANPHEKMISFTEHDVAADWWVLFHSRALDQIIRHAFVENAAVDVANANLRSARETVEAQRGAFFPSFTAAYSPSRTKLAGNLGGNSPGVQGDGSVISTTQSAPAAQGGNAPFNAPVIYSFHTAQLSIAYLPDVFGGTRRQLESVEAQQQIQRFQLEAAYVTLASNIVAAAFQDASLRRQIDLVAETVRGNEVAVEIARRQLGAGLISRLELAAQQVALAQSRQLLPPLLKQFEQNADSLKTLAGLPVDAELPKFELDDFAMPTVLPLALPSSLIEQRPDVRAAEEQLRSASAQVGVAHAARLPQFSLTGNAGGAASKFGEMFWSSGKFFDLTANLAQTVFDGGALRHRERAADEILHGAVASYRVAVATAFQNVADVLHAIDADESALLSARQATQATHSALETATLQHQRGLQDRLFLIAAEQNDRLARISLTQARAQLLTDSAALFQSLGGGWWHRVPQEQASSGAGLISGSGKAFD